MGKLGAFARSLWRFLDGWKTFILVPLLMLEAHCQVNACPGPFGYLGAIINGLGWRHVAPAIDPGEVSKWLAVTIALGHKLVKAFRQARRGVPINRLLSGS